MTQSSSETPSSAARAVIYCRVSTDGQERDGTSLVTQDEACRSYAARNGLLVIATCRDAASGSSLERPGLDEVRRLVRAREVDSVIAFSLDRLSRSQNHVGILDDECQRAGVRLEFATERFEDTAVGRFVRAARAFTDELEREKIRERTMRGKYQRATEGRLVQGTGRGIFGYILSARSSGGDGRRRTNEQQAKVVRRIFEDFVDGKSLHAISRALTDEGVETLLGWRADGSNGPARKVPWHPLTVRRILMNPAYKGVTLYGRTTVEWHVDPSSGRKKRRVAIRPEADWVEVPGATPAIVADDLWARAQELLTEPPIRTRRGRAVYPYPLRGHIRCAQCRGPLAGSALSGGRGRSPIRYYTCRRRFNFESDERCDSRYVRADLLESSLAAGLQSMLAEPARIRHAYAQVAANHIETAADTREAERQVQDAAGALERLARIARLAADADAEVALARELKAAGNKKRQAEARLAELRKAGLAMPLPEDDTTLNVVAERVREWLESDVAHLELALESFAITVWADGVGPARVQGSIPLVSTHEHNDHAHVRPMVTKDS